MGTVVTLLDIACGRSIPTEDSGPARKLELTVLALLASLVFAGLWGAALGSHASGMAIANLYKVPMVVLLSGIFAAPAGLIAWRLAGAPLRGADLALAFAGGVFGGSVVLAALAPLVALYYHSSAWAGPVLGLGSALLACATGAIVFFRGVSHRVERGRSTMAAFVPVLVVLGMQLATIVQLGAIAAPIFPERTPFSGGIDHIAASKASTP
jgi:hypothetical protein